MVPVSVAVETITTETTRIEVRPRYEGNNVCAWIGFKHINYMVEDAVLGHFRASGLSSRTLYEEFGVGLDIIRLDTRILNALHLDDEAIATVVPVETQDGTLRFKVTLSKTEDAKDVTATVSVTLRRDTYIDSDDRVPSELRAFTVDRIGSDVTVAGVEAVDPGGWGSLGTHRDDAVLEVLTAGRNAIGWSWRIPYPYCHNNERLEMSGYLRLIEEAKDRFVADRGISVKTLLDDRRWIPVVSRSTISMLGEALMEELLYVVFTVEEVFKDMTYTSRMDCYVAREGSLIHTATGTIVHGYAEIHDRRNWSLVSLDDRVLSAIRG